MDQMERQGMNGIQRLLWRMLRAAGPGRPDAQPQTTEAVREALDNLSDAVAFYDAEDRLVVCNTAFAALHADTPGLIRPGAPFEQIITSAAMTGMVDMPAKLRGAWAALRIEFRRKGGASMEREFRLSDGRWFRVTDCRTRSDGYLSILSDITELTHRKRALGEAWHATELANHAKFEFLANMSHELRTPLNAIMGFAEMIRSEVRGPLGDPAYREYGLAIEESAGHLRDVIGDILELSRFEAGSIVLNEEAVDIDELLRSAQQSLAPHAKGSDIHVRVEIEVGLPGIWADMRLIRQIVINLLSNAIKFSNPGSEIILRASTDTDGMVEIVVSDRGIGIDADHIAKIMQPFEQVETSMTRAHHGVGLGLPLARMFCEAHDADLSIESMPGVGTSVVVTFPRERIHELRAVGE